MHLHCAPYLAQTLTLQALFTLTLLCVTVTPCLGESPLNACASKSAVECVQDHYDVKMPCHLLLAKLAAAAPGPVLASLDKLVGPLEKTLTARLRGEPVKQEVLEGWLGWK